MAWLIRLIKLFVFKKEWRKNNKHNSTYPLELFPYSAAVVGRQSYGGLNILSFGEGYAVKIGNFCSIGPNVIFVLKADHRIDSISTFPFRVKALGEQYEATSKGDIILDDDVWIGANATILSGVHVGQGAVVAAGAVVTKDVPPYAIVGGNPAKLIRYRFEEEIIEYLLSLDYSKLTNDIIRKNKDGLYIKAAEMTTEEIKKQYYWFPKKKRT